MVMGQAGRARGDRPLRAEPGTGVRGIQVSAKTFFKVV